MLSWRGGVTDEVITTAYTYDALNRPTLKTYSDGTPTVGYTYDNNPVVPNSVGRLTQVTNGWSTTNITGYDALGRITGSQQILAGQTYNFAYGYNLTGALTSETYPSGRVVTTGYDPMNRANGVAGVFNNATTNYVTGAT